ncbi:beta-lactamase class A [Enterobacter sp. BIGb0383]|uniref:class A beta-lactamase n=1 Tax=unclassified Enterobacter TaxID=2608935 RepID=UPI000F479123|nr:MULTISPECIES: class A beta-lactamase [unclassified Enterobacter]ROP62188.1 beta-lactamase class A [Enterobacter sp. BIGb0383]ROS12349.1 beta-lactamase class A [Enterobacter sp. BIGb0359]
MFFRYKSVCFLLMLGSASVSALPLDDTALEAVVKQEEQALNARIGVAAIDMATGKKVSYRGNERFPLNSTHKALSCAALLSEVDKGRLALTSSTRFSQSRLVDYSPVTEKFVEPASITWRHLCSAAVSDSDNTAANLVVERVGGPAAVTRFLRTTGDNVTRLDRDEPELNSAIPGDERDTTTPIAVSQTLQKLALGEALKLPSRRQLIQWMRDDKVADALLRSVLPAGWSIADKTGAGANGSRSIIAVVWPLTGKPMIVAIYITETEASLTQSNEAIARLGKALFAADQ